MISAEASDPKSRLQPQPIDALLTLLVWDAHEAVARMLDSVEQHALQSADWRLYILDQGSQPMTADLLAKFAARQGRRVHLERLIENIGYPAGHNLLHRMALRNCAPRYVVTLNSDLVFHDSHWLDTLVRFMDAHTDVGLSGPTGVVYQRTPPDRLGWCRVASSDEMRAGVYDSISGSLCILRECMIEQIGLFDESFTPGYFEDTDLAFRAKACGWRIAPCEVAHGHHDLGAEKSTSYIKRDQLAALYGNFQKRNRNLFVERWLVPGVDSLDAGACRRMFPAVYFPTPVTSTTKRNAATAYI